MTDTLLYERPFHLLQQLIRFDTTNPPGNELACVQYINTLLQEAGIETMLLAKDPNRPNLVARLAGRGAATPLLLQGHVDVVTTADQEWQHDPFGGELIDGFVWGRGALDMKGGVAMMVSALLRAKAENVSLPGDVILLILSDEENAGTYGAKFMVEEHAELFTDVQYALGEFGGFSMSIAGQRFYPIMVAEKQACWLQMTLRGPGGHGSMPIRGGAMAQLGHVLSMLDKRPLPVHITPPARLMIEAIADALPFPTSQVLRGLLNPRLTDTLINQLGDQLGRFAPLLHNTVSPTVVNGGHKTNVIPSEIVLQLDGRLLPGFTADHLILELVQLLQQPVDIEVLSYDHNPSTVDMGLFEMLKGVLQEADPAGQPIPMILPGVTDGRFFSRLGIQTYGFLPMTLPDEFNFSQTIHAADERVPAEAIQFGSDAIFQAIQRF